jgi:hypothetical protein
MTGAEFEIAMDVEKVPGDEELLASHRWTIRNPREISADFDEYRNFIKSSRGEFTVAKGMNIRFRSGWFSDRAACYLAAGRPAIEGDTGFADVLPVGPGLWAFRDVREAAEAIRAVERNYAVASAHAVAVAREYFAADRVLGPMLKTVGL